MKGDERAGRFSFPGRVATIPGTVLHRQFTFFVAIGLLFTFAGCQSTPPQPAPTAPQVPSVENVNIDFKDLKPETGLLTIGLSRPSSKSDLSAEQRRALAPLLAEPAPLLVTLGETVKFDGAFPGDQRDWEKWDRGVEQAWRKYASLGTAVNWEIWNEADRKEVFKGGQSGFFSIWVHTAQLLRKLDSQCILVGPSTSKHDWVQEFLKVAKEFDVEPDVVCWHEEATKADVAGHMNGSVESFWQDGTDRRRIRIMQTVSSARQYVPGDMVILMAGIQDAYRATGWRMVEEELAFKTHHLATDAGEPRAIMLAMQWVQGLSGTPCKVEKTDSVQGLAARDDSKRMLEIVLGRAKGKAATKPAVEAEVKLNIRNLPGQAAHLKITRIAATGAAAATQPSTLVDRDFEIKNGEIKFPLNHFHPGQALDIKVELLRNAPAMPTIPAATRT